MGISGYYRDNRMLTNTNTGLGNMGYGNAGDMLSDLMKDEYAARQAQAISAAARPSGYGSRGGIPSVEHPAAPERGSDLQQAMARAEFERVNPMRQGYHMVPSIYGTRWVRGQIAYQAPTHVTDVKMGEPSQEEILRGQREALRAASETDAASARQRKQLEEEYAPTYRPLTMGYQGYRAGGR
jgi:hypothetical protein